MKVNFPWVYKDIIKPIVQAVLLGAAFPILKINAKGGRGSAKTFSLGALLCVIVGLIAKTKIHAFRYLKDDLKKTTIQDFLNVFEIYKIPYIFIKNENKISFGKGSEIHFFGLKKNKSEKMALTGLGSAMTFEYGIILKDEIAEYDEMESQEVNEAVRGFAGGKLLEIKTWNPFDALHFANLHFLKYLQNDAEKMKKDFYNIRICHTRENDCVEAFVQTNIFVNKFADDNLVRELKTLPERDPLRAETATWGLDGTPQNSLFPAAEFKDINYKTIMQWKDDCSGDSNIMSFRIGFDYGRVDSAVITLCAIHKEYGLVLCESYGYNRTKEPWVSDLVLATWFAFKVDEWIIKYRLSNTTNLYYDYDNATFPEFMHAKMAMKDRVRIIRAEKEWSIYQRVIFLRQLIGIKKVWINQDCISNYMVVKQIRNASAVLDANGKWKRLDGNDDWYQAFEYSWSYANKKMFEYLWTKKIN